jgi:uncharacterized membrane protein
LRFVSVVVYDVGMTKTIVPYFVCFLVMLAIDGVWLTLIARNFYKANLGELLAEKPDWGAAIIFYFLFVLGVIVFVVSPCLEGGQIARAALMGALFGLVTYATYDLTNQATVKNWPVLVTIVDLCWGTALTATVSAATVWLSGMLLDYQS